MNAAINDKMRQLQAASEAVAKLQAAQEEARKICVGWRSMLPPKGDDRAWLKDKFSPYRPPETENRPPGFGNDPTVPHQPYATVKSRYDDAGGKIARVLRDFPALYAVSRFNRSDQSAAFVKIRGPDTAREVLGQALDHLVKDIKGAEGKLKPGGTLNPLDLRLTQRSPRPSDSSRHVIKNSISTAAHWKPAPTRN